MACFLPHAQLRLFLFLGTSLLLLPEGSLLILSQPGCVLVIYVLHCGPQLRCGTTITHAAPYGVTSFSSLQDFQAFGYMFTWGLFLWVLFLFAGVQLHETETLCGPYLHVYQLYKTMGFIVTFST